MIINIENNKLCLVDEKGNTVFRIKPSDIDQINTFKLDNFTTDEIILEFIVAGDKYQISEEYDGFREIFEYLKNNFGPIKPDWYTEVMGPAFETNFVIIYQKE